MFHSCCHLLFGRGHIRRAKRSIQTIRLRRWTSKWCQMTGWKWRLQALLLLRGWTLYLDMICCQILLKNVNVVVDLWQLVCVRLFLDIISWLLQIQILAIIYVLSWLLQLLNLLIIVVCRIFHKLLLILGHKVWWLLSCIWNRSRTFNQFLFGCVLALRLTHFHLNWRGLSLLLVPFKILTLFCLLFFNRNEVFNDFQLSFWPMNGPLWFSDVIFLVICGLVLPHWMIKISS